MTTDKVTWQIPIEYVVKDVNHQMITHPYSIELWNGYGSTVHNNGSVIRFIYEYLKSLPIKTVFVTRRSDYVLEIPKELLDYAKAMDATLIGMQLAALPGKRLSNTFLSPACDEFFDRPVLDILKPHHIPWEERLPVAFWRGGRSGDMIRVEVVSKLTGIPQTDVKMTERFARSDCNPTTNPEWFAETVSIQEQMKYKALVYIDGNSVASNATWIFASGAVPIMVGDYDFWFKHMLEPWKHYIPVKRDLSDLVQNIDWIWENDEAARRIAENAMEFAATMLSPENQRHHIVRELTRIISSPQTAEDASRKQ